MSNNLKWNVSYHIYKKPVRVQTRTGLFASFIMRIITFYNVINVALAFLAIALIVYVFGPTITASFEHSEMA